MDAVIIITLKKTALTTPSQWVQAMREGGPFVCVKCKYDLKNAVEPSQRGKVSNQA